MMNSRNSNRRCLHFDVGPKKLLKAAKCAAVEFFGHPVGTGEIRIDHANQSHWFAIFRKLVIDARVIAPKCTDANYGNRSGDDLRQIVLRDTVAEGLKNTSKAGNQHLSGELFLETRCSALIAHRSSSSATRSDRHDTPHVAPRPST